MNIFRPLKWFKEITHAWRRDRDIDPSELSRVKVLEELFKVPPVARPTDPVLTDVETAWLKDVAKGVAPR